MNVSFMPLISHHRHQHCLWTVHNCHYAYTLCTTVTMHTDCARLSLCVQSVHKCYYAYRLCTTVIMSTDCAQLSLCVHTVHNCHYVYRLCTIVIMRTDCAHMSLCIQTLQNCHYAYSLCTTVTMCTHCAQLSLCVQTVHNCHYTYTLCATVTMRTSHLSVYPIAVKLSLVLHKIFPHTIICSVTVSPVMLLFIQVSLSYNNSFSISVIFLNKLQTKIVNTQFLSIFLQFCVQ